MIEWFTKSADSPDFAQSEDDPRMALVGDTTPDWVRMPPELGGAQVRVAAVGRGPCICKRQHDVQHLQLDNGVFVAECDQYLWYKPRGE